MIQYTQVKYGIREDHGMLWWETVLRLLIATAIGIVIGIQREFKKNSAGMRTHALVSLGACIAMLTNEYLFLKYGDSTDVARMASYVLSGIGFLGAGTIIKDGLRVRGLTTAAGLWVLASLGIAAGAGFYAVAIAGTAIVVIVITSGREETADECSQISFYHDSGGIARQHDQLCAGSGHAASVRARAVHPGRCERGTVSPRPA